MTTVSSRLRGVLLGVALAALAIPATADGNHLPDPEGFGHSNTLPAAQFTRTTCNLVEPCFQVVNVAGTGILTEVTGLTSGGDALFAHTLSTNANANAVHALHDEPTGTAPAILGESDSGSFGAVAIQGTLDDTTAGGGSIGVYGFNRSATGAGIGVKGEQDGAGWGVFGTTLNGRGVYGTNTGATSTGTNAAVYGVNSSDSALASSVYGNITSTASYSAGVRGRNAASGFGGFGVFGEHAGTGIGVYGEALGGFAVSGFSPGNWSGYFQGDMRVVGNLQKNSGSFTIDHPLDPAKKYLSHSFVESPDMMNVYNGNVRTDRRGFATVKLPRYFGALNRSFRYQLTPLGKSAWGARVVVWEKIKDNRFTIRSEPGVEISWQVTGIRKDAWANAHRIKVEEAKTGSEAGKYLNPELYGKPLTQSVVVLPGMRKPNARGGSPASQ